MTPITTRPFAGIFYANTSTNGRGTPEFQHRQNFAGAFVPQSTNPREWTLYPHTYYATYHTTCNTSYTRPYLTYGGGTRSPAPS